MGCGCRKNNKDDDDFSRGDLKSLKNKDYKANIASLVSNESKQTVPSKKFNQPNERMKTTIRIKPEIGLYDTRIWDHLYQQHAQDKGPRPG